MIDSLSIRVIRPARKRSGHLLRWAIALLVVGLGIGMLIPATTVAQGSSPAVEETNLDVTLTHDLLPDSYGFAILGRVNMEPGARQTLPERGEQGTIVIVVEQGTLTYRIEGDGRIIRGANTTAPQEDAAPAGAPFTLAAGDALVYPAQARIEANETAEPVVYLYAVIFAPIGPPDPNPSDVGVSSEEQLGYVEGDWPNLVPGPTTITLTRTLLEAGERVSPPTDGTWIVRQETGEPGVLATDPDGGMRNSGDAPVEILVLSIEPAPVVGTPVA